MESLEIHIASFQNPHFFCIINNDLKHRSSFLHDLSTRIKRSHAALPHDSVLVDEIVAVYYGSKLVRASIIEISLNKETNKSTYFCWLIDYAISIKTEQVYKIPREIQKVTPQAKQACLNNFCYLKEQMELGITGKVKSFPSVVPSSGVTQHCLDVLLNNYSKLVFEVTERYNNVLIGELLIHKNGKVINLTQELCDKGLVTRDEVIFQKIKYSTPDYIKMNLETIHQTCRTQIGPPMSDSEVSVFPVQKVLDDKMEEIDIDTSPVLENGRRRKGLHYKSSQTSGSEEEVQRNQSRTGRLLDKLKKAHVEKTPSGKESLLEFEVKTNAILNESQNECDKKVPENNRIETAAENNENQIRPEGVLSRTARALQKLKELKALEEAKKDVNENTVDDTESSSVKSVKTSDDALRKLADLRLRKQRTLSSSTKSTEGFDSSNDSSLDDGKNVEQTTDDSKKSPFQDITSQRKSKPAGVFVPAGMEGRYNKERQQELAKKSSKGGKSEKRTHHVPKSTSGSTADEDCPTIKIPQPSGNLTDDQMSSREVEDDSKKEEESSSDIPSKEIFTKQDFCRLVAGCTCIKCRVTLEDDDWDAPLKFGSSDSEIKKKRESTGPIIKPSKLLRKEVENETYVQENEIISIDYGGMSSLEKKMSCKVLVHGESLPNPIKRVAHVPIHRDIYNNIDRLNYKEAKRIQHYAFPAITRNQHVFMINDSGSGKTMAYLPILSSFIMEKEERYSQLFKMGGGPIVVILCSNSKKCEEIYDLTKLIFDRQRCKVSLVTYPGYGNISNVDILITMPTILNSLISTRATNFKRLCHFVLEDGDVILQSHQQLIEKFLNYGDQVLEHRHCPKSIQIILCAEHWTPQIENILKKLNKVPLVCIGNHLEAALYGKLSFSMKFLDTSCKEQNLQRVLHDIYKFTKSIIICNSPDEVEDIATFLPLKGIEFTALTDVRNEADILYNEGSWSNAMPGKYSVLVCTDDIYNTMNITSAQLLIHYSLPRSWTQFIRRFSCLLENNPTPLNIKGRKATVSTFVFIDEHCEPRMSKFCNFIKIAGLEKDLPEKIKLFFKEIATKEEYKRVTKKIELCETLKIFGKCDSLHCKKRHILDNELDLSDILPTNGLIKFKIIKMTSVTSCSIKLLEHFDLKGQSIQKFENFADDISEILSKKGSYHNVSKPMENNLYLYKEGDTFCRCKLLEIDEHALIYLIDKGTYCKSDLGRLFSMPKELKKIPPQCYEVHFANLIPPHEDTKFSRSAKHKAQFLVDSNCPNSVMTANIVLQLGNNLWLEDVNEEREMFDKTLPSTGYQLTRELVRQELAVKSDKPLADLYTLCKNSGIELPEYKMEKLKTKKVVIAQVKPQWAFLDMDDINQVQFSSSASPGEFYIKLQKFNKQLAQLEQDIQVEIRKPFYPVPQKIEVGKCYLLEDEPTGNYARGLVLNITDDCAHMFCVDYGDDVIVPLSTLKHISNDLILKLPFQSIQCSMFGIKPIDDDSWYGEATDFLYKMGFEDGSNIFRTLFVKTCSKQENIVAPNQNSYSVIVKDGSNDRHILLNDLLIDCGFVLPNGAEIKDFELPEHKEEIEDEDIEEIICNGGDIAVEVEDDQHKDYGYEEGFDAFDVEIFDVKDFMTMMNFPLRKINDDKAIEERKTENDDLPPMKVAPAVDYLTPKVLWSQTGRSIKLAIKITDVENPKVALKHNRIFQFKTQTNGKKYLFELMFYEKVEKTFQYTILGPEIRIRLTKCKEEEWPRLAFSKEKVRNVRYDWSTVKDDEKPRRPLQLDISDSSSEDDENDGVKYHVCSDLDSEYDYDIPNDEG